MLPLGHKHEHVYQQALLLAKEIYRITTLFPDMERAVLVFTLRRTAIGLCQQIALSSGKKNNKRRRIYKAAVETCIEIDTQLELAIAVNLIDAATVDEGFKYLHAIHKHLTTSNAID